MSATDLLDPRLFHPATVRLGKTKPSYDERTLKLSNYLHKPSLPTPPPTVDQTGGRLQWPMFDNDQAGDCTCATAAGFIGQWTATGGRSAVDLDNQQVLAAYSAVTRPPYDPATGENDNGANELTVLRYWRKHGIGGHKIGGFAAINTRDLAEVYTALWLFDGVYVGAALPATCQGAASWVVDAAAGSQAYPGSWGGHAFGAVKAVQPGPDAADDNDPATGLAVRTWGGIIPVSWAWWLAYVDEAYAVFSEDYVLPDGKTQEGFDVEALKSDLRGL